MTDNLEPGGEAVMEALRAMSGRIEELEAERDALADDLDAMRRTIAPIYKLREEREALAAENERLRKRVDALEAFRPQWAMGYSSDSVAAQATLSKLIALEVERDALAEALLQEDNSPMTDRKTIRPAPMCNWNDMEEGQIAWHVSPEGDGWLVARVFGPEGLIENPSADVFEFPKPQETPTDD
jgi:hypothetical protein